tara:strand:- start:654 stop:1658 length:1005 start_codon:yes stop_codon:yes gene_type:complete
MKSILVTGCAGFIGFYISKKLIVKGYKIIGVDNLNNYYSRKSKLDRLDILKKYKNFYFYKIDINNLLILKKIFKKHKFNKILHFAAQPGVQYSFKNPQNYIKNNINGFLSILELAKEIKCKHLIFASSSSVYGLNKKYPLSENQNVDHPISIYSMTKRGNELMAHVYSHNFNLPITGLRFFTAYGPYGRPDMAVLKFISKIYQGKKIDLYNYGKNIRDFTFVEDAVDRIFSLINKIPKSSKNLKTLAPNKSRSRLRILNVGTSKTIRVTELIKIIEKTLNIKANKKYLPSLQGDVSKTYADDKNLRRVIKTKSKTTYHDGIKKTVMWYLKSIKK